eukprot:SAG22_NODE_779_length_7272_cov_146.237418_6_plen_53_part_00
MFMYTLESDENEFGWTYSRSASNATAQTCTGTTRGRMDLEAQLQAFKKEQEA